jgi:UTP--glucose-1-phosphate uridylyltransferase
VYDVDAVTAQLSRTVDPAPVIELAKDVYGMIGDFDERFAHGAPSLARAKRLEVEGRWTFGRGVSVVGTAVLGPEGGTVEDGTVLGEV